MKTPKSAQESPGEKQYNINIRAKSLSPVNSMPMPQVAQQNCPRGLHFFYNYREIHLCVEVKNPQKLHSFPTIGRTFLSSKLA